MGNSIFIDKLFLLKQEILVFFNAGERKYPLYLMYQTTKY